MNDCYHKNNKKYDWLLFYELDEFIHLSNYTNVKSFLNQKKFVKCQIIYLNLVVHNDNDQLFYQNNSLYERFPNIVQKSRESSLQVKMIIKGGIKNIKILTTAKCIISNIKHDLTSCNGFGNNIIQKSLFTNITDYNLYYIDHFYCKSTEEFIKKLSRGDIFNSGKDLEKYKLARIRRYFKYNKITKEKIEMIEKSLKIDLSQLKIFKNNII